MKKQSTHYLALFFFIFFLFLANTATRAQCIADAGNDTTFCWNYTLQDSVFHVIGGNPAAIGGTPPYTYSWDTDYHVVILQDIINWNASDFLNDTSIANPKIIGKHWNHDPVTFVLTVTDSLGMVCKDSITVTFCEFWYPPMPLKYPPLNITINQGDSVIIGPLKKGNCSPFSYYWEPDYNITDPTEKNPLVWPDSSTSYRLILTDSIGCITEDTINIIVKDDVKEESFTKDSISFQIFPNPAKNVLNISYELPFTGKSADFYIYNSLGEKIDDFQLPLGEDHIQRDVSELTPGTYFYFMVVDDAIKKKGKFLITR